LAESAGTCCWKGFYHSKEHAVVLMSLHPGDQRSVWLRCEPELAYAARGADRLIGACFGAVMGR
jgi:hypothetical protein